MSKFKFILILLFLVLTYHAHMWAQTSQRALIPSGRSLPDDLPANGIDVIAPVTNDFNNNILQNNFNNQIPSANPPPSGDPIGLNKDSDITEKLLNNVAEPVNTNRVTSPPVPPVAPLEPNKSAYVEPLLSTPDMSILEDKNIEETSASKNYKQPDGPRYPSKDADLYPNFSLDLIPGEKISSISPSTVPGPWENISQNDSPLNLPPPQGKNDISPSINPQNSPDGTIQYPPVSDINQQPTQETSPYSNIKRAPSQSSSPAAVIPPGDDALRFSTKSPDGSPSVPPDEGDIAYITAKDKKKVLAKDQTVGADSAGLGFDTNPRKTSSKQDETDFQNPEFTENLDATITTSSLAVQKDKIKEDETISKSTTTTNPVVATPVVAQAPVEKDIANTYNTGTENNNIKTVSNLQGQQYIQIAGYNSQSQAERTINDFRSKYANFPQEKFAIYKAGNSKNSTTYYRVLVGPFSASEIGLQMYQLREMGYADSFIAK